MTPYDTLRQPAPRLELRVGALALAARRRRDGRVVDRHVRLDATPTITQASALALAESCKGLSELSLRYCRNVSRAALLRLQKDFPRLRVVRHD